MEAAYINKSYKRYWICQGIKRCLNYISKHHYSNNHWNINSLIVMHVIVLSYSKLFFWAEEKAVRQIKIDIKSNQIKSCWFFKKSNQIMIQWFLRKSLENQINGSIGKITDPWCWGISRIQDHSLYRVDKNMRCWRINL